MDSKQAWAEKTPYGERKVEAREGREQAGEYWIAMLLLIPPIKINNYHANYITHTNTHPLEGNPTPRINRKRKIRTEKAPRESRVAVEIEAKRQIDK